MTVLPPPTGSPVPTGETGDAWEEQARRRAAHRRERRRRRRRRAGRLIGWTAILSVAAVGGYWLAGQRPEAVPTIGADDTFTRASTAPPPETPPTTPPRVDTIAAVDEVWLLDRGDGTYDWGATIRSLTDELRRDLTMTATLIDDAGDVAGIATLVIAELPPDAAVPVGGRVDAADLPTEREGDGPAVTPPLLRRVEVEVTVGVAASDAAPVATEAVDVRRVPALRVGQDDRLLGAVRVDGVVETGSVARVVALWRDDDGSVRAVATADVDAPPAGERSEFSVRLERSIVPAGDPDSVAVVLVGAA